MSESISRRRALTVVAVPAVAALSTAAITLPVAPTSDAELLELGERCKVLALETRRLSKLFHKAGVQTERAFYAMKPERWVCSGYLGSGTVVRDADAWWVRAVDGAPRWFAVSLNIEEPKSLPEKWIQCRAVRRKRGRKLACSAILSADFWEKRKQAGVPFNRDGHYKNWVKSHSVLRRAVAQLAKLKATTVEGLNMKAMVLAIADDAFDDPDIWSEPLQKSISRDIGRIAAA